MSGLFSELRRRNVFKVAALYIVVSWLILQVTDVFMDLLPLPDWTGYLIFLLLVIGFPLAVFFAWAYEMTPEGLRPETELPGSPSSGRAAGRKLDFWIIAVLLLALAYFAWNHDWSADRGDDVAAPMTDTGDTVKSIAVLPFVNMSEDPANEYFSEGISEEILNVLVGVDGLRVISRTSSFAFKDRGVDLPTIARTLNVDHVLEGSVRKSGKRVRITAQLIDVNTDSHLWSDSYERELQDIFAIQKDISLNIAGALEAALGTASSPIFADQIMVTDDLEAYEAYLQGRYRLHHRGRLRTAGLEEAIELFGQAIERDPEFAQAWAGLGAAHAMYPGYARSDFRDSAPEAERALGRAIELDPVNGEAHAALALLRMQQSRWLEAEQSFRKALRVDPAYETTYVWYGAMLTSAGKSAQARDTLLLAADKDPASGIGANWLADIYRNLGDMERSYQEARRGVELGTTNASLAVYFYHRRNHDWDAARQALRQFGVGYGVEGEWPDLLIAATQDPLAIPALHREVGEILEASPGFYYGWMYFDLDDTELLLDVMEDYAARGDIVSMAYGAWEPKFTALRNHPRFAALMEEVGLLDYWRATGWPDVCRQSTDELVCD